jgi:ionotropic glutamate receptor
MANVKKGDKKPETKQTAISAISLKNLTGAFLVLLIGCSVSVLAFLVEQIASMVERNVNNRKTFHEISNEPAFSASPI